MSVSTGGQLEELDDAPLDVRHLFRNWEVRGFLSRSIPGAVELSTLRLLRAVEQFDGHPSVGDVATFLAIDPSNASKLVDQTVRNGLLERSPCSDDSRPIRLQLTLFGSWVVLEVSRTLRELLPRVTSEWLAGDLAELTRLFGTHRDSFDQL